LLTKIDKYILRNFLLTFIFALLLFSLIALVIDYTEKVSDFVKHDVSGRDVLNYFKNFLPHILNLLFHIFIFVSVIFFTSRMAYRSEFIAILSTGIEFKRLLLPYAIGAIILASVQWYAGHYIIPVANKDRLEFERNYVGNTKITKASEIHQRLSKNEFLFLKSYNAATNNGYVFSYIKTDGIKLKKKISASRCEYDSLKNLWVLYEVTQRENDGLKEKFRRHARFDFPLKIKPEQILKKHEARQHMTTPEIDAYVQEQRDKGSSGLNEYLIERHKRNAQPFATFILTIIGACIAIRKVRGGNGLHLALGVALSAAYILFMQFSTTFAVKGNLSPLIATWIPNIIFSLIAVYIYKRASS